jgi:hypothetical protein
MDNLGHRENGRQRLEQYKAMHTQVYVTDHINSFAAFVFTCSCCEN